MTTLTTRELFSIAPFKEEVREKRLDKLPFMSRDEISQLEQACWDALTQLCLARAKFIFDEELHKMAERKTDQPISLERIKDEAIHMLFEDFKIIETIKDGGKIEEIRRRLKQALGPPGP